MFQFVIYLNVSLYCLSCIKLEHTRTDNLKCTNL